MLLINRKTNLSLDLAKSYVMFTVAGDTTFKIADAKLYIPIVNLSTKDNVKLTKQLNEGSKRVVYWNQYNTAIE